MLTTLSKLQQHFEADELMIKLAPNFKRYDCSGHYVAMTTHKLWVAYQQGFATGRTYG